MATKLATKIANHLFARGWQNNIHNRYLNANQDMAEDIDWYIKDKIISKSEVELLRWGRGELCRQALKNFDLGDQNRRLNAALIEEEIVSNRHYNRAQALKDRLWDTEKELAEVKKALAAANEIAWRPASPYVAGTFVHVQEADMPAPVSLWQRVTNWSR